MALSCRLGCKYIIILEVDAQKIVNIIIFVFIFIIEAAAVLFETVT